MEKFLVNTLHLVKMLLFTLILLIVLLEFTPMIVISKVDQFSSGSSTRKLVSSQKREELEMALRYTLLKKRLIHWVSLQTTQKLLIWIKERTLGSRLQLTHLMMSSILNSREILHLRSCNSWLDSSLLPLACFTYSLEWLRKMSKRPKSRMLTEPEPVTTETHLSLISSLEEWTTNILSSQLKIQDKFLQLNLNHHFLLSNTQKLNCWQMLKDRCRELTTGRTMASVPTIWSTWLMRKEVALMILILKETTKIISNFSPTSPRIEYAKIWNQIDYVKD